MVEPGWYAGVFDCCGTIYVRRTVNASGRTSHSPVVTVRAGLGVLHLFQRRFGGTVRDNRGRAREWTIVGKPTLTVALALLEDGPLRAQELRLVVRFFDVDVGLGRGGRVTPEAHAHRERISEEIHRLGPATAPFVRFPWSAGAEL